MPAPQRRPLLQRRRRHQPGGRQGQLLPLHPGLAGRPRRHRRRASPPAPQLSPEHARMWLAARRPLAAARRQIEGDPDDRRDGPLGARGGAAALLDELRLSLDFYGAQEARAAGRAGRPLRPRQRDPRPRRARWSRRSACRSRSAGRRRSRTSTPLPPPASPFPTDWPWTGSDAPRQPDPERGAARRAPAAARRPARLHRRRRPARRPASASPPWSSPTTRSPTAKPKITRVAGRSRRDGSAGAVAQPPTPSSTASANSGSRR